jgi:hypothetical protein
MTAIHTFDGRQAVLVDPSEIRVGDWMRDLGRLRQVEAVEESSDSPVAGTLVRFSDAADGPYTTLSIPAGGITVTVWRDFVEQPC